MTLTEVLTLVIALWGAIVATLLGIREVQREKRLLLVYLDFISGYKVYQIRVVNIGHRPITLVGAQVERSFRHGPKPMLVDSAPIQKLISPEEDLPVEFPITLGDGEFSTFALPHRLTDDLHATLDWWRVQDAKERVDVYVIDAEGKRHVAKEGNRFNPKTQTIIKTQQF